MKTPSLLSTLGFTLGSLAAPVSDTPLSNSQRPPRHNLHLPLPGRNQLPPLIVPSERKYCNTASYTNSDIWARNGQCNAFADRPVAIKVEQWEDGRCELVAYEGQGCRGSEWHLGGVGVLSVEGGVGE